MVVWEIKSREEVGLNARMARSGTSFTQRVIDGRRPPTPQYEAKVGSGVTTGANPGSDWSERGAEAPRMVGALASPTTIFCNQHPYHDKDHFN